MIKSLRGAGFFAILLGVAAAFSPFLDAGTLSGLNWARYSVLTVAGPAQPSAETVRRLHHLVYTEKLVQSREWNIWRIARDYGTTVPSLQATNNNELLLMRPGTKILVHNKRGLLYFIQKDVESLDSVIAKFQKNLEKARRLKEKTVRANDLPGTALSRPYDLVRGEYLLLPDVHVDFDTYRFPFKDSGWHRVSSGFGRRLHPILKYIRFHDGWDLPKPHGTPVYASRSGQVLYGGWREGYGNMVEVRHPDNARTLYGHLSRVSVRSGQWVQRGQTLLGRVGSSGLSTGPHLHFEVRDRNGRPLNPRNKIGHR